MPKMGVSEERNVPRLVFSTFDLREESVVAYTKLSYCISSHRPYCERGHWLVVPRRVAVDLGDLTSEERHDIIDLVSAIDKAVRSHAKTDSVFVGIQGGPAAGRTVDHLHFHVIPRFEHSDELYDDLDEVEREMAPPRVDVAALVAELRPHVAALDIEGITVL